MVIITLMSMRRLIFPVLGLRACAGFATSSPLSGSRFLPRVAAAGGSSLQSHPNHHHRYRRNRPVAMLFNLFGGGAELGTGPRINYEKLAGLPASLGAEAAGYALAGEVPSKAKDGSAIATFAGGCFWGLELAYQRLPGVIGTCVGYTKGQVEKPTYKEVCTGRSGHTEAVMVNYDPKEISYQELLEVLFSRIDPTLLNQVGNDRGTQYRTGVYTHDCAQLKTTQQFFEGKKGSYRGPIVVECEDAAVFWPAEEYHQQYLEKGGQDARKGATQTIRCYG